MAPTWEEPGYAKPVKELRKMSDEFLEEQHDVAFGGGRPVGPEYYLDELARREANRQGERVEKLTEQLVELTKRIQWLTVASFCAVLLSVIVSVVVLAS